jgi:hypothetical protein
VRAWRDAALRQGAPDIDSPLSPQGLEEVWRVAFEALTDEALDEAWSLPARPPRRAAFVAARTVATACLEWCAVWWGRGTEVCLKVPRAAAGLGPWLQTSADTHGLPLEVVTDPAAVRGDLVVAMGRDETIDALREQLPSDARFIGFGHRFSVAACDTAAGLRALAADLAMHDTRGCLSPVAVFSDHAEAERILADAMADAQQRWPRGRLHDHEHATLRQRAVLARVVGRVRQGEGWAVHTLPAARFVPVAGPRLAVVHPGGVQALLDSVEPHRRHLSTVGTDVHHDVLRAALPEARVVVAGQMQRPPLRRRHDGIDWVRAAVGAAG